MVRLSILAPLLLTVAGGVMYHLAAKSVPKAVDPALALVVLYATALAASAVVYLALPGTRAPLALTSALHPAVLGVGLGAVMIELGYLLIYRAAWPVSVASVLTNGIVAVLLIPIGITVFGEPMTAARAAGVALCLLGLSLLRR